MEECAIETDGQLDLFGQERIKLGEGYAALARLEPDKAAAIFGDLVRENPDFADAAEGKAMAIEWGDSLWEIESLKPEAAALSLWDKVRSASFGFWGDGLRKALIRRAIDLIWNTEDFFIPPALCLGFLHFEAGQYEQAERALRKLLEKHPDNIRLLCLLGNSLVLQRRPAEARSLYAKALLRSPGDLDAGAFSDDATAALVRMHGCCLAPIYGWMEGVLPLLDAGQETAHDQEHDRALGIYRVITRAERALKRRDHAGMVEQRKILKELDPEFFAAYLARIAG